MANEARVARLAANKPEGADRKAYMIGDGIGSLAAAAFMIRDGGVPGRNITIFEAMPVLGDSLDGGGTGEEGYTLRGGRMLTTDNYECTWGLFKSIPSLASPGKTVFGETIEFNVRNVSHSKARLVDRDGRKVDVTSMGFSMQDRIELVRLSEAGEDTLGASRITAWLSPPFFETKFWYMWSTTFAFQPWHSAIEFKRYLHRFMLEFSRIETLAGVKRTVYNQFDSLVGPLGELAGGAGGKRSHRVHGD
jgi:oleate hydratase